MLTAWENRGFKVVDDGTGGECLPHLVARRVHAHLTVDIFNDGEPPNDPAAPVTVMVRWGMDNENADEENRADGNGVLFRFPNSAAALASLGFLEEWGMDYID